MTENVAENLIETGSIPEGKVSIENAIADMGKAATLAEWVYAGLRIETRDWSAELRKSSEVQLPKFALLESGIDHTGSLFNEAPDQKSVSFKHVGSSVGLSGGSDSTLDQTLSGVRDAKVMGLDGFRPSLAIDNSNVSTVQTQFTGSFAPAVAPIVMPKVTPVVSEIVVAVETPVVEAAVTPEIVVAVETPVVEAAVTPEVIAAVETPVVEAVATPEVVDLVETPVIETVVTPEVIAPVETPVIEAVIPEFNLNSGRLYFHDFDSSRANIVIQSDSISDFDSLVANANLYQDEGSVVIELYNGADLVILTQFALGQITADMFEFEPSSLNSGTASVFVRDIPVAPVEAPVSGDVFTFGLGSGRLYVTDFDTMSDQIFIKADLFSSFEEMMSRVAVYQDATSTVFELHDGADMIILPHFSLENVSANMFVFEAETLQTSVTVTAIEYGSAQDDTLIFGAGDQMIDPGLGFDVVTGGEGHDSFIFGATSGHDFIIDFKAGEDHIQIASDLASDFAGLLDKATIYQDGGATQIEFAGGQLITLYDTNAKLASADWFSFS